MSIYTTLWEIKIRRRHRFDDVWVEVFAQAVRAFIGYSSDYPNGDPYADFLPPLTQKYDPSMDSGQIYRAVVIVQAGRDQKDVQRYTDPLMVMSGDEYLRMSFQELLDRIEAAVGWDEDVVACSYSPTGEKKIIRVPGWLKLEQEQR